MQPARNTKVANYTVIHPCLNYILCMDESGQQVNITYSRFKELQNEYHTIH